MKITDPNIFRKLFPEMSCSLSASGMNRLNADSNKSDSVLDPYGGTHVWVLSSPCFCILTTWQVSRGSMRGSRKTHNDIYHGGCRMNSNRLHHTLQLVRQIGINSYKRRNFGKNVLIIVCKINKGEISIQVSFELKALFPNCCFQQVLNQATIVQNTRMQRCLKTI